MKLSLVQMFYSNIWEPLWAGYLISYCKLYYKGKLDINFYHGNFDKEEDILKNVLNSDIIAFSATTCTFQSVVTFAKKIKKINKNIRIVLGGVHVSSTLENPDLECIDHIIVGEGETGLLNVLNDNTDKIIYGKMLDFSELDWPNRFKINQERHLDYCKQVCGQRILSLVSKRGCSHSCTICSEKNISHNNIRVRDVSDVLNEIKYCQQKYNIDYFKFADPTWVEKDITSAVEFCEEKIRRGNKLPWQCMAHSAYLTKDILTLLKKANCDQIAIGCESGSQKILNEINKGTTPSIIKKVFKWGKELELDMRGFFITGLPNETRETLEETRQLIKDIDPSVFGMTLLCPYPGTKYYKDEFKDWNWELCGEYDNPYWSTDNFTNQELKNIIKEFNNEFQEKLVVHQRSNV
jgi:anaerobic magnesium-protoporphyrin IX monomethyl ester cyclase